MLIPSQRPRRRDLEVWEERQRMDDRYLACALADMDRRERVAMDAIDAFAAGGMAYVGVSWGKDSVVVAHLAWRVRPQLPFVWIRVEPIVNPDCALVRDEFMMRHIGGEYHEIVEQCRRDDQGWHASGTLERGFARAPATRYISGIRAQESSIRALSVSIHGVATERTCRPIARWHGEHVFAYLRRYDLPVHPAYACSFGGMIDRDRLRVSSLGGERGGGKGRSEWERRYYGDALRAIEARR